MNLGKYGVFYECEWVYDDMGEEEYTSVKAICLQISAIGFKDLFDLWLKVFVVVAINWHYCTSTMAGASRENYLALVTHQK